MLVSIALATMLALAIGDALALALALATSLDDVSIGSARDVAWRVVATSAAAIAASVTPPMTAHPREGARGAATIGSTPDTLLSIASAGCAFAFADV